MKNFFSSIPFGKPLVDSKEIKEVEKVLRSCIYVHGKKCLEFENNFKDHAENLVVVLVALQNPVRILYLSTDTLLLP